MYPNHQMSRISITYSFFRRKFCSDKLEIGRQCVERNIAVLRLTLKMQIKVWTCLLFRFLKSTEARIFEPTQLQLGKQWRKKIGKEEKKWRKNKKKTQKQKRLIAVWALKKCHLIPVKFFNQLSYLNHFYKDEVSNLPKSSLIWTIPFIWTLRVLKKKAVKLQPMDCSKRGNS